MGTEVGSSERKVDGEGVVGEGGGVGDESSAERRRFSRV
jgi:hypothetical protein